MAVAEHQQALGPLGLLAFQAGEEVAQILAAHVNHHGPVDHRNRLAEPAALHQGVGQDHRRLGVGRIGGRGLARHVHRVAYAAVLHQGPGQPDQRHHVAGGLPQMGKQQALRLGEAALLVQRFDDGGVEHGGPYAIRPA